jgi:hypothetical protein
VVCEDFLKGYCALGIKVYYTIRPMSDHGAQLLKVEGL